MCKLNYLHILSYTDLHLKNLNALHVGMFQLLVKILVQARIVYIQTVFYGLCLIIKYILSYLISFSGVIGEITCLAAQSFEDTPIAVVISNIILSILHISLWIFKDKIVWFKHILFLTEHDKGLGRAKKLCLALSKTHTHAHIVCLH